jgi:D-lyxose ketol-isomerase
LFPFPIRNGSLAELKARRGKLYCEKLMVVGEDRVTPMHFHLNRVEDIINRGRQVGDEVAQRDAWEWFG